MLRIYCLRPKLPLQNWYRPFAPEIT
eukprot:COSAG03_NODE_18522_length_353_cov_0.980315_1_plen_25_part_01